MNTSREPSPSTGGVRVGDLSALLVRVVAAEGADRYVDCWLACAFEGFFPVPKQWPELTGEMTWRVDFCCHDDGDLVSPGHGGDQMVRPYTASLDAALALCERVLPGCRLDLSIWPIRPAHVTLILPSLDVGPLSYRSFAKTPALAVCAAVLKAKIAEAASPASGPSKAPDAP